MLHRKLAWPVKGAFEWRIPPFYESLPLTKPHRTGFVGTAPHPKVLHTTLRLLLVFSCRSPVGLHVLGPTNGSGRSCFDHGTLELNSDPSTLAPTLSSQICNERVGLPKDPIFAPILLVRELGENPVTVLISGMKEKSNLKRPRESSRKILHDPGYAATSAYESHTVLLIHSSPHVGAVTA